MLELTFSIVALINQFIDYIEKSLDNANIPIRNTTNTIKNVGIMVFDCTGILEPAFPMLAPISQYIGCT